ncbi:hypothetical protein QOT17_008458 [Balamuthia mandrillaris]
MIPAFLQRTRINVDCQLPEDRLSKNFAHLPQCSGKPQKLCGVLPQRSSTQEPHPLSLLLLTHCNITLCIKKDKNCFEEYHQPNDQ